MGVWHRFTDEKALQELPVDDSGKKWHAIFAIAIEATQFMARETSS